MTKFLETLSAFELALDGAGVKLSEPFASDLGAVVRVSSRPEEGASAWNSPDVAAWLAWGGPAPTESGIPVPVFANFEKISFDRARNLEPQFAKWYGDAAEWYERMEWDVDMAAFGATWVPLTTSVHEKRTLLWNSAHQEIYAQYRWDHELFMRIDSSLDELLGVWLELEGGDFSYDLTSNIWKPTRADIDWTAEIWKKAGLI